MISTDCGAVATVKLSHYGVYDEIPTAAQVMYAVLTFALPKADAFFQTVRCLTRLCKDLAFLTAQVSCQKRNAGSPIVLGAFAAEQPRHGAACWLLAGSGGLRALGRAGDSKGPEKRLYQLVSADTIVWPASRHNHYVL